jgi:hypothetical protein
MEEGQLARRFSNCNIFYCSKVISRGDICEMMQWIATYMSIAEAKETIKINIKIGLSLTSTFIVNSKVWVFFLNSCDCKLSNTFLRVGVHIPLRILSFKPSLKIIHKSLTVKSTNSKLFFAKVNSDLLQFYHLINIHTIVPCECWWDICQIMCDCLII